jgi:DNA-binding response OmpR family regulator
MNERILTIYSSKDGFQALNTYLSNKDYEVFHAETGEESISSFRQNKPDYVILDLHLEDTDSLDILEMMRDENSNIEVITVSTQKDLNLAIKSLSYEASDFLL